jgi:hypothetical protein
MNIIFVNLIYLLEFITFSLVVILHITTSYYILDTTCEYIFPICVCATQILRKIDSLIRRWFQCQKRTFFFFISGLPLDVSKLNVNL